MMEKQHRNVIVLSGCQAALQTTTATMVSVTGLAGFALATDKSLATIPLTCYVLGSAITTIPASPPFLLLATVATLWLMWHRRAASAAPVRPVEGQPAGD